MTGPHVTFVCTGNICRSPMAQNIVRHAVADAGLAARIDSCGTGPWHAGDPADRRARAALRTAGYDDAHIAAQVSPAHLSADLVVALDTGHARDLRRLGAGDRTRLLRSFDPTADGPDVADPYYGDDSGFELVRTQIEAAAPGIVAWIAENQR